MEATEAADAPKPANRGVVLADAGQFHVGCAAWCPGCALFLSGSLQSGFGSMSCKGFTVSDYRGCDMIALHSLAAFVI